MSSLSPDKEDKVLQKTNSIIQSLLRFVVSYRAVEFVHNYNHSHWREFEDLLHHDYPVKGVGVKANSSNLDKIEAYNGGFLHAEETLYPGEITSEFDSFPYEAASSAYIFTLLEGYGNDLVEIVNPNTLNKRDSWHKGVHADCDLKNASAVYKAKERFAAPFKSHASKIPKYAVERLIKIKAARNSYMHEGKTSMSFEDFSSSAIGTAIFLHFLLLPNGDELSIYPFDDYDEKWNSVISNKLRRQEFES